MIKWKYNGKTGWTKPGFIRVSEVIVIREKKMGTFQMSPMMATVTENFSMFIVH